MPARKNRPGKSGSSAAPVLKSSLRNAAETILKWETATPNGDHYCPWPLVAEMDLLWKKGFITQTMARGCYRRGPKWDEMVAQLRSFGVINV